MTKTIIVADMHGVDPCETIEEERRLNGIEDAVFLGDYDTPEVLGNIMALQIPKRFVIGNHDHSYLKRFGIRSNKMHMSAQDYSDLWYMKSNSAERKYLEKMWNQPSKNSGVNIRSKLENGKNVVYCHAAIASLEKDYQGIPIILWQRLYSNEAILCNVKQMRAKRDWIMFRGHDDGGVLSIDRKNKIKELEGDTIRFSKDKRYIVTLEAYYHGGYAIFDSEQRVVRLKNSRKGRRVRGI